MNNNRQNQLPITLASTQEINESVYYTILKFIFAGKPGDFSCKNTLHIFYLVYAQLGISIAKETNC